MGYSWFDYLYIGASLSAVGFFVGVVIIVDVIFFERKRGKEVWPAKIKKHEVKK